MVIGSYIGQYLKDIQVLFQSEVVKNKFQIFILYNYLALKVLIGKIFRINFKSQRIFGYKTFFGDFGSFFSLFTDLFIYNVYHIKLNKKNPIIVDAGANVGMATLYFKYLYPKAQIYAYEPDKRCFGYLSKLIKFNKIKGVTLINAALGDKKGEMKLYCSDDIDGSSGSSLLNEKMMKEDIKYSTIKVETIESLNLEKIDLFKLDIEGYEGVVLKHLDKIKFLDKIDNFNLEFHYIDKNKDNNLTDILKIFDKYKFSYIINSNVIQNYFVRKDEFVKRNGNYVLLIDAFKNFNQKKLK